MPDETTAIAVRFEVRENHVFVIIRRLVDGKVPMYPIFIKHDTVLDLFYLDDLIKLRLPSIKVGADDDVEVKIPKYADALQKCATDVLQGDFSVFPELEQVVKNRAGIDLL